jgi:putative ABC transport system permease protein
VLGATVGQIVALFSRDVVVLVAIGFALAVPLVLVWSDRWLAGFAYAAPVGWTVIAVAGLVVLVVAVLTVCTQAARAATANPIHALRSE